MDTDDRIMIFKNIDKSVMSNSWPISLTPAMDKMLNSIILRKIREHLELHRLITDSAWGH